MKVQQVQKMHQLIAAAVAAFMAPLIHASPELLPIPEVRDTIPAQTVIRLGTGFRAVCSKTKHVPSITASRGKPAESKSFLVSSYQSRFPQLSFSFDGVGLTWRFDPIKGELLDFPPEIEVPSSLSLSNSERARLMQMLGPALSIVMKAYTSVYGVPLIQSKQIVREFVLPPMFQGSPAWHGFLGYTPISAGEVDGRKVLILATHGQMRTSELNKKSGANDEIAFDSSGWEARDTQSGLILQSSTENKLMINQEATGYSEIENVEGVPNFV